MPRTLISIVAHPDDELSAGGTLARYRAAGHRAIVVCSTRGDGVDAKIKNDAATRETLGLVRQQELAASCNTLGLEPPIVLGFQDGEVDAVPVEEAAERVLGLFLALKPDVVITHDPGGGYGHPDHIAVSTFVTRAYAKARQVMGQAAPRKLYYYALPRSFGETLAAFRDRRADIRGQQLGFVGVPDEQISTQIDVREYLDLKQRALACHRSQFDFDENGAPKTFTTSVPEPERSQLFGVERFIWAETLDGLPISAPLEDDLLAGL
jgi:LmbE family N-acetylglucosaminyl deacetylase